MDTDDQVGGLAGAMMSPAAFGIAKWGQRVGPFVGPMKSAMGFDADDELGRPAHTRGTLELKTLKLEEAELKYLESKNIAGYLPFLKDFLIIG